MAWEAASRRFRGYWKYGALTRFFAQIARASGSPVSRRLDVRERCRTEREKKRVCLGDPYHRCSPRGRMRRVAMHGFEHGIAQPLIFRHRSAYAQCQGTGPTASNPVFAAAAICSFSRRAISRFLRGADSIFFAAIFPHRMTKLGVSPGVLIFFPACVA
jgi:hypothetical protein